MKTDEFVKSRIHFRLAGLSVSCLVFGVKLGSVAAIGNRVCGKAWLELERHPSGAQKVDQDLTDLTRRVNQTGKIENMKKEIQNKFAICIENKDSEDLEKRKIYQVLPDEVAEGEGYFRVIDESGRRISPPGLF
jgi:hypothetical protein